VILGGIGSYTSVYACCNLIEATVNPLGYRTTLGYDVLDRQVQVTNSLGYVSTSVFDAAGRPQAAINPLGFRTTSVYDAAGQPIAQIDQRQTDHHDLRRPRPGPGPGQCPGLPHDHRV
jgi:YD repeat-containing protein